MNLREQSKYLVSFCESNNYIHGKIEEIIHKIVCSDFYCYIPCHHQNEDSPEEYYHNDCCVMVNSGNYNVPDQSLCTLDAKDLKRHLVRFLEWVEERETEREEILEDLLQRLTD